MFLQPMSIVPLAAVPQSQLLSVKPVRLVLNTRLLTQADGLWLVVKVAWYYGKTMLTDWKESVASRALVGVNAGTVGCHGTRWGATLPLAVQQARNGDGDVVVRALGGWWSVSRPRSGGNCCAVCPIARPATAVQWAVRRALARKQPRVAVRCATTGLAAGHTHGADAAPGGRGRNGGCGVHTAVLHR